MKMIVFVTKQFRAVHYHPNVKGVSEDINKARPHLSHPHEHIFKLTVGLRVSHENREKDLLLLNKRVEDIISVGSMDFGDSSFESMCLELRKRYFPDAHSIKLEEYDEGAEVIFEENGQ